MGGCGAQVDVAGKRKGTEPEQHNVDGDVSEAEGESGRPEVGRREGITENDFFEWLAWDAYNTVTLLP